MTWTIEVPGEPVSKERPRFGRGHPYTPKKTRDAEQNIATLFRIQWPHWRPDALSTFEVDVAFDVTGRQDVDNLVKLVLDALNRTVWRDDAQVVTLTASVHRNAPDPYTWIHITRIPAPDNVVTAKCVRCGADFALPKPTSKARFCSTGCRRA